MKNDQVVDVQILDKTYQFRCSVEEKEALQKAALLVDANMRMIRDFHTVAGTERIAIYAALIIAVESINDQNNHEQLTTETTQRLQRLLTKIQTTLTHAEQFEL